VHFDGRRIDVHFAQKNLNDANALEWATKLRETLLKFIESAPELKFIPVHACFQENFLTNEGVSHFCEALLHDRIQIDSLKLYKNQINDEGALHVARLIENVKYPITEIHLSHNLIMIKSARAIFSAIRRVGKDLKYPCLPINAPPSCTKPVPLWLRLEHNFIDLLLARQALNELKIKDCGAESHKVRKTATCGPRKCCIDWENSLEPDETPLHIFSFQYQYTPTSLEETQNSDVSLDDVAEGAGPLFIFLDTNAVLAMASNDKGFCFQKLLDKASEGKFGVSLPESQRTSIVLPFTVLRELDALKLEPRLRRTVAKLHKEILPQGRDNGAVELLNDRFQARLQAESGSSSNNDSRILREIQLYGEGLRSAARIFLLTGDRSMITLGKQMAITVMEIQQLEISFDMTQQVWGSDAFWNCLQSDAPSSSLDTYVSAMDCLSESIAVTGALVEIIGDSPEHAALISRTKILMEKCKMICQETV